MQCLLCLICGLLPAFLVWLFMFGNEGYCQAPSLLNTPVPNMPRELITFEKNASFIDRPSPETDRAWEDLYPPGRGFVYIENGVQYGFEPGEATRDGRELYSISLYHQIHCLRLIRDNFWKVLDAIETKDQDSVWEEYQNQLGNHHAFHCFDYILQSLRCAGDMALEWPMEVDGHRNTYDGYGVKHECKSQSAMMDWYMPIRY